MLFQNLLSSVTKSHVERKILSTHPRHLFRIIEDVDRYSEFLPLCTNSQVLRKTDHGFQATLTVGMPPLFTETYVSQVRVDPVALLIETKSIESKLFESLQSRWQLAEHPTISGLSTKVDFEVQLTVRDPIVVATLDQVLREVAGRQVAAFEQRCREIPVPPELKQQ